MISLHPTYLKQWQDEHLERLRYEYPDIKEHETVLDIGSYRREWGNAMIEKYTVKVESFDALDNKAAWKFNGKLAMGGAYYYTSMYEPAVTEYWCVDIAPYLQQEIAVVKINIEGGEYELLEYIISKGLMKNIRNLQVQFHYIEGKDCERMYQVLAQLLSLTHTLQWRYPFCWESWERKGTRVLIGVNNEIKEMVCVDDSKFKGGDAIPPLC